MGYPHLHGEMCARDRLRFRRKTEGSFKKRSERQTFVCLYGEPKFLVSSPLYLNQVLLPGIPGNPRTHEMLLGTHGQGFGVQLQRVVGRRQRHRLVAGENLMTSVLLVPLRQR